MNIRELKTLLESFGEEYDSYTVVISGMELLALPETYTVDNVRLDTLKHQLVIE